MAHLFLKSLKNRIIMPISSKIRILIIGGRKIKKTLVKNISRQREFAVLYNEDLKFSRIKELISGNEVDEIILADSTVEKEKILNLISICEQNGIEFKMVPDML